jgi:hypothetical protein
MSQLLIEAVTKDGQSVMVTLGWDRPLGGYFAVVEKKRIALGEAAGAFAEDADDQGGEDEKSHFVYCNLDDLELAESYGMSPEVDYFVGVLERLGINLPATMLEAVRRDGEMNMGNMQVLYDSQGRPVQRH